MALKKPKVVLFDLEGTLGNGHFIYTRALELFLQDRGLKLPDDIAARVSDRRLRDNASDDSLPVILEAGAINKFLELHGKPAISDISGALLPYVLKARNAFVPVEGGAAFLDLLRRDGVKIGCVTDVVKDLALHALEDMGLRTPEDVLVAREDCKERKPSPKPVALALKKLEYDGERDRVWFVGDGGGDMDAAKAAGCSPIAFGKGSSAAKGDDVEIVDGFNVLTERYKEACKIRGR